MDDAQEILLIRHGATDMAGKLCGHTDPPLNAVGRGQAHALISLLRSRDIGQIYASDLLRAVQTAEYLTNSFQVPVVVRSDLREISFGKWEGRRWSEIKASLPGLSIQSFESSGERLAPGGESFIHFQQRAIGALKSIANESRSHATAVVTHMGVIRVAMRHFAGLDYANLQQQQQIDPCGVYRFAIRRNVFTYAGELTMTIE